jgi:hypothetical protein
MEWGRCMPCRVLYSVLMLTRVETRCRGASVVSVYIWCRASRRLHRLDQSPKRPFRRAPIANARRAAQASPSPPLLLSPWTLRQHFCSPPDTHGSGQMSEAEALAVLHVPQRRPKWLLSQVHPDKHPQVSRRRPLCTIYRLCGYGTRQSSHGCTQQACD